MDYLPTFAPKKTYPVLQLLWGRLFCGWSFWGSTTLGTTLPQNPNPNPSKPWSFFLPLPFPPKRNKTSFQGKFYTFYFCHYSLVLLEPLVFMVFRIGITNFHPDDLLPASSGDQDQTMGVNREAGSFVPRDCWRCIQFLFVRFFLCVSRWWIPAGPEISQWLHFLVFLEVHCCHVLLKVFWCYHHTILNKK